MKKPDLLGRTIGQSRGRLLYRAMRACGSSRTPSEGAEAAGWALGVWATSATPNTRGSGAWRWRVRSAALDWLLSHCTFEESRERMADALANSETHDLPTRELLSLRALIGTLGFFSLTENLLNRAMDRAIQDFSYSQNRWSARNAFTAHVLRGNFTEAVEPFDYCTRVGTFRDWELVSAFLNWCLEDRPRNVADNDVTIIGPGPIGNLGPDFALDLPVCRVVMPGVTSWSDGDIVKGRVDFAYLNGDTTEWVSSLGKADRASLVSSFKEVRIKQQTFWEGDHAHVSQVYRIKDLFLTGEPNMVPTIIVDQLMRGASRAFVTGTTFFIGAEPYRSSERRHFPKIDSGSDSHGAVDRESFERCYSHASHDQIVNRAIIRHLFEAGRVTGDDKFKNALLMGDREYLDQLEADYGAHRR